MVGKMKKLATSQAPITKGHLGLKSNALSPTDSKLISQYLVQGQMEAHYRKLTKAKAAVDTSPPKAWMISQKVRDQARREAVKAQISRRDKWLKSTTPRAHSARSYTSQVSSINEREGVFAAMQSVYDASYDVIDGKRPHSSTTLEVHLGSNKTDSIHDPSKLNTTEMDYIDRLVDDTKVSPSQYKNNSKVASNIPSRNSQHSSKSRPKPNSTHNSALNATMRLHSESASYDVQSITSARTPRAVSGDVLNTRAEHFTEEKPFQPRTLKTNSTSKLSQFKYYNPPKKQATRNGIKSSPVKSRSGPVLARPSTPMTNQTTESQDLMLNETLMSRDLNSGTSRTPTGVPPLDISLDKDHMSWLKEQSKKAQVRVGKRNKSQEQGLTKELALETYKKAPDGSNHTVVPYSITSGMFTGEEELKYLEFVTDVTNDVLDRGIFTNRMLKQVFEYHIDKKAHELKPTRMREMLEELRVDLGIPLSEDEDDDGVGLGGTKSSRNISIRKSNSFDEPDHAPLHHGNTAVAMKQSWKPPLPRATNQKRVSHAGNAFKQDDPLMGGDYLSLENDTKNTEPSNVLNNGDAGQLNQSIDISKEENIDFGETMTINGAEDSLKQSETNEMAEYLSDLTVSIGNKDMEMENSEQYKQQDPLLKTMKTSFQTNCERRNKEDEMEANKTKHEEESKSPELSSESRKNSIIDTGRTSESLGVSTLDEEEDF